METLDRKVAIGSKVKFKKMPNSRTKDFTIGKDYEIVKIGKYRKTFLFDNPSDPKFGIRNDKGIIKWFIFSDVWFSFDKSGQTQIEKMEADKAELLEMLEFIYGYGEKVSWEKVRPDLESLIQKHKPCDIK